MATEDEMKKAREIGRQLQNVLGVGALPATTESTGEMEAGSPRSPGHDAHSGKEMKPIASATEAGLPSEPSLLSEATLSAFDKALAALKEQDSKGTQEQEKNKGIDL